MLKSIIEALIFAAAKGLTEDAIVAHLVIQYPKDDIKKALKELKEDYSGDKGIILITVNEKLQMQSNPNYGVVLADILRPIKEKELSKTLLEVLAIIAYKQPITRLEIENIRGISSEYACSMLYNHNLIDVIGRKDTLGRPVLYGTTDEFLKKFRISSLAELPEYDDLLNKIKNNFDKYYEKSDGLYREREILQNSEKSNSLDNVSQIAEPKIETEASDLALGSDMFFEDETDDIPDFLKGENFVEVK